MSYEQLQAARSVIEDATGCDRHELAVVLGSGLGDYAASLDGAIKLPFEKIPGFPVPKIEGHRKSLYSTKFGDSDALVLAGRVHFYEGWSMGEVVFAVRTAVLCGCKTIVLTNASGGLREDLTPGDLVLISDHINLTGHNPLLGPNDERLGPRFPDMSHVYDEELRTLAQETGKTLGMDLAEGVYAWFTGPTYETPAEIQMVARMGGHLAGMSTVPEAMAARHMGARVLGISLVTNLAAGISPTPLSHEEVTEIGQEARPRFAALLNALLPAI